MGHGFFIFLSLVLFSIPIHASKKSKSLRGRETRKQAVKLVNRSQNQVGVADLKKLVLKEGHFKLSESEKKTVEKNLDKIETSLSPSQKHIKEKQKAVDFSYNLINLAKENISQKDKAILLGLTTRHLASILRSKNKNTIQNYYFFLQKVYEPLISSKSSIDNALKGASIAYVKSIKGKVGLEAKKEAESWLEALKKLCKL